MKKLLTLIAALIIVNVAKAQYYSSSTYREDSWHVNIGPEGFYNFNPGHAIYPYGYGGALRLEYYPNNYMGIIVNTGFRMLKAKAPTVNFKYIPVTAGIKGFFLPQWYLGGEFGAAYTDPQMGYTTKIAKVIAPSIGYNNTDYNFDISIRYENVHAQDHYVSQLALSLTYSFDLTGGGY